jgi:hypothetical protein
MSVRRVKRVTTVTMLKLRKDDAGADQKFATVVTLVTSYTSSSTRMPASASVSF